MQEKKINNNNNHKYEYMDDASVDSELICSICNKPFIDPVSTSCDHTFCQDCIKRWIDKGKKTCPTCRHKIPTTDQFTQVSRPLRNILDRLQIKCSTCGQTGLQRDNFNDHINKICQKVHIPCTASDIKCPWTGLREELPQHLLTCKFEPLRTLLSQLLTENEQLLAAQEKLNTERQKYYEQVQQHHIQFNELTNKLLIINNLQPLLEKVNEDITNSTIDFSQQKLTDRDLTNITKQIMNKKCTVLQLQGNTITSQGINTLLEGLSNNSSTLQDLWLSNNCISDLGVRTLVDEFLYSNSTLKHLHLGSNCITNKGVECLTEFLEMNNTLTDLWLYNNQINDIGVRYLMVGLKTENRSLKHVDLQWNKSITDASVNIIMSMLDSNRSLERLNLRKCNLSIKGKMQLLQAVAERKNFKLII